MTSQCINTLTVTGTHVLVEQLWKTVAGEGTALSLDIILPTPTHLLDRDRAVHLENDEYLSLLWTEPHTEEQLEAENWYTWRVRNWGTKFDVRAEKVCTVTDDDGISISATRYLSAGSPPIEALDALAGHWPTLVFEATYEEPDADICGALTWVGGAIVEHSEGSMR